MNSPEIIENIEWIASGKIGCVFASALVKNHDSIGWNFTVNPYKLEPPKGCFIYSAVFPGGNIQSVKKWAINNGMWIQLVSDMYEGLRMSQGSLISWVQYFGPDSHVKTRQTPHPMLSFCCRLPVKYYHKVGFNGILHLAHASVQGLKDTVADILWERSIEKTKKELGFSPTIREAAKTTYEK